MPETTPHSPLSTPDSDEINLLDYWRVLVKRKVLIGTIVAVAAVASVIISLLLPNIFAATSSILPPQQDNTVSSAMISQLPGGIGGLAGGILGVQTPSDLWVGILNSRTIKDALIDRFDLMKLLKAKTRTDARSALTGMMKVVKSKEDIISITVESEDPDLAAKLANAAVEELDHVNRGLQNTSGRRMKTFVEERLKDAKAELARSEDALKNFQKENKAVQIDEQSKAVIEAVGTLKGQLMAKEVELQTLLSFAEPTNPQVEMVQSEIEGLKSRLREMGEGAKKDAGGASDIFIPTSKIPDLALDYLRLFRDAKVQETVYELLTKQYEMARIQEAKDTPTVQVLDTATVPEKKVKPKRRQIVILTVLVSGFLAVFLAFFLEYIERMKRVTRD
jgi:tyrosine-protein kinase Etk/Wzc